MARVRGEVALAAHRVPDRDQGTLGVQPADPKGDRENQQAADGEDGEEDGQRALLGDPVGHDLDDEGLVARPTRGATGFGPGLPSTFASSIDSPLRRASSTPVVFGSWASKTCVTSGNVASLGPMTKASVPADDPPTKLGPGVGRDRPDTIWLKDGAAHDAHRRGGGEDVHPWGEDGGSLAELLDRGRLEAAGNREVDERAEEDQHGERRAAAPGEESPADAADQGGVGSSAGRSRRPTIR